MSEREPSMWAAGWATFAGLMMIMLGIFHAIAGLAEIVNSDSFVVTQDYVFKFNTAAWGWIHLIGGIIVVFAGFGVFRGAVWARTVGVIIAMISAIFDSSLGWIAMKPALNQRCAPPNTVP